MPFESFSVQHFSMLFVLGVLTWWAVDRGKRGDDDAKMQLALNLAGFTFSMLLIEAIVKFSAGQYDILTDLPLFLCDIVTIMLPFVIYYRSRKWIGILYFWALAGTAQALITPELEEGFPSFHFFRYFIMHGGIVAVVLYAIVVWKIRITWRDWVSAVLYAQLYLVLVHLINQFLGSNYSYTLHKPADPTILDYFGPWPWYILIGEGLMLVLFLLLMIPFFGKGVPENSSTEHDSFG